MRQSVQSARQETLRAAFVQSGCGRPIVLPMDTPKGSGRERDGHPAVSSFSLALSQQIRLSLQEEADASSALRDNAAWLRSNAAHIEAKLEASAQNHNGTDLSVLVAKDPAYCQWILRQAKEKHASPELRANASWLRQNAPHLEARVFHYSRIASFEFRWFHSLNPAASTGDGRCLSSQLKTHFTADGSCEKSKPPLS
ncbi:unnamed protein product [Symbiodinium natans]|uniref:Uncharacterized protein n=1 Tax=Symbiodinium natans TaxID=878477 RepID=A0A812N0J7_9DINO|nr:unnamed protein product [Symbiodinium natans]